jgi:hypothetical protein
VHVCRVCGVDLPCINQLVHAHVGCNRVRAVAKVPWGFGFLFVQRKLMGVAMVKSQLHTNNLIVHTSTCTGRLLCHLSIAYHHLTVDSTLSTARPHPTQQPAQLHPHFIEGCPTEWEWLPTVRTPTLMKTVVNVVLTSKGCNSAVHAARQSLRNNLAVLLQTMRRDSQVCVPPSTRLVFRMCRSCL